MHHRFGNTPFNMRGNWIILIILIIIIAIVVYMIVKNKKENKKTSGSKALDILDERFAKGEIDEEEYKNKKEKLKRRDSDPK